MEEKTEERGGKTEEKRREMISALWCQDPSKARRGPSPQTPRSGGDKVGKWVWPAGEDVRREAANSSGAFPTRQPRYPPPSLVGYLEGGEASSTLTHWSLEGILVLLTLGLFPLCSCTSLSQPRSVLWLVLNTGPPPILLLPCHA